MSICLCVKTTKIYGHIFVEKGLRCPWYKIIQSGPCESLMRTLAAVWREMTPLYCLSLSLSLCLCLCLSLCLAPGPLAWDTGGHRCPATHLYTINLQTSCASKSTCFYFFILPLSGRQPDLRRWSPAVNNQQSLSYDTSILKSLSGNTVNSVQDGSQIQFSTVTA